MTHSIPHPTGVVPPLARLVMKTGSLETLRPANVAHWTKIAEMLRAAFPQGGAQRDDVHLFTSYSAHGLAQPEVVTEHDTKLMTVARLLLEHLMEANGQWSYLKAQPWFTDGGHLVAIDANYYPNREVKGGQPQFHKDTAGNNVFVNLLFDNPDPIPATEWLVDVGEPGFRRRLLQESLLPPGYLKDLDEARLHLRATTAADEPVSGGVTEGANTYVSWVDDLIWHATPTDVNRHAYTAAQASVLYDLVDARSRAGSLSHVYDGRIGEFVSVPELLGSIAECPTTHLRHVLGAKFGPQDVDYPTVDVLWKKVYAGGEGRARYLEDVAKRGASEWRLTGHIANASTTDPGAPGSSQLFETPAGLSSRRRRNSDPATKVDVLLALLTQIAKGHPRSFLRTWVRVIPRNSEEGRRAFPQR
ncbi:hypothetical protein [Actinosynnema mirum]|uniref:Uncharacterized protein n=1 Tax=Actinosynnema mirum (strain ATCC 29888 / DSM 43827 / JCM 3225 / NBRC 14064 / NCIMB 13271 / NRRL B-12336 / IMRU 3971 / 101) TaxID=446462 RepID=C6WFD8_ACTMD|nr:hypothetical protein [Actinosynnema mirum]ACU35873.1 hypothetical protein Amir_1925 [Actinosynnema mirum DSM 43827]